MWKESSGALLGNAAVQNSPVPLGASDKPAAFHPAAHRFLLLLFYMLVMEESLFRICFFFFVAIPGII